MSERDDGLYLLIITFFPMILSFLDRLIYTFNRLKKRKAFLYKLCILIANLRMRILCIKIFFFNVHIFKL